MGKKAALFLAAAIVAMVVAPAAAFGALTNEYGMRFAGENWCKGCHTTMGNSLHERFATAGLMPSPPAGWTAFKAAGNPPQVAGTKGARWNSGGEYSITGDKWVTLGDSLGNSATEYLFWKGSTDPKVIPWNLVEGLMWEPSGEWLVGAEAPSTGLYDVTYGCQRCHMLGSTVPTATTTDTASVPNPAATIKASFTTARQWARDATSTVADFMSDPGVSAAGFGIQCESCHGSGLSIGDKGHTSTGTEVLTSMEALGKSQVCGQCHGSFTNVAGTLGIYGYTPNQPLRNFVDVNGKSGGQSYTKIPTVAEFMASPAAYWMFPNGSNAKGGHYYYDEWAASAHSYRSAETTSSPDAMAFQAAGHGHYSNNFDPTLSAGCYKCHTGEGYLKSKDASIAEDFTPTKDNVGKMGQECLTCHNGHPSAVGAEDVVREADQAGERSATGLSKANDSICEDCHNWQYEVMGTQPAYAPMADLSAHASPSHPQRETLEGRSMVEVAVAGTFMPGAKCEECHMTKTNKAANRISHGMKPMLPGDAETWMTAAGASYQGEDACSNCHAGQTRSELQANIDDWQTAATAQAQKAAAAITAAQKSKEYSLTDTAKPGYKLVGKATWNYKVWENDASDGVHNPEYIVHGLVKAESLAKSVGGSFKYIYAPSSLKKGRAAYVSGTVRNGDGSNAAGAKVMLYKNGEATSKTAMTDGSGAFSFRIKPSTKTSYKVVWQRSSENSTRLKSATLTVKVVK